MKASRRNFLRLSGLGLGALSLPLATGAQGESDRLSIIADPADEIASSPPCRWASQQLSQALEQHAIRVAHFAFPQQAPSNSFAIVVSASDRQPALELLKNSGLSFSERPECLALVPFSNHGRRGILACGDARGLMYALLELADRIQHSDHPLAALDQRQAVAECPFNSIRGVGRIFCSDIQDKPWFYDRQMWPAYFSMLATQRFNRFSLNLGVGYDFLDNVSDAYFLFAYPFLLAVPGYNVRAVNLPEKERDRNLEMLEFISSQAVDHGIDFQLGIWTHGYQWGPASQPNYTIEGLSRDNHAAYSRAALSALLNACPHISGITLRTHGESGVSEGSYSFWSTVFSALAASGRQVRLDLHTKGLDQKLIDLALATQVPVTLSPKYWAEHMGLPYQQTAIRNLEMPREEANRQSFFSLSSGSRSFTRYSYGDFLREDRLYNVTFRIWPGSHRFLLWGDPSSTAAHARAFNFCGSDGVELFEPLSFKGRRGSGIAGSRCAYADLSLVPRWDWEKYLYSYRVWGRLTYNPDTSPDAWRRQLEKTFRAAAPAIEAALASATSITSIITTAHSPSAANETFHPEFYTNQPIVQESKSSPYHDTPAPKVFGNVSPLDPKLFSSISEFAGELLTKEASAKYSPFEVAQWLESSAEAAASQLKAAETRVDDKTSPQFRRAAMDIRIQTGLGRFFAAKMRSGVLYAAYERSGDRAALEQAVEQYRGARDIWQSFAEEARRAYVSDITFGTMPHQRGHWLDRLAAINEDLAEMQKRLESPTLASPPDNSVSVPKLSSPARPWFPLQHTPALSFIPGQPLAIAVSVTESVSQLLKIQLCYRHVNQAEKYESTDMQREGERFGAVIPASYTKSKYPLQYYFELRPTADNAWLFPGLGNNLRTQPYFVVRPLS